MTQVEMKKRDGTETGRFLVGVAEDGKELDPKQFFAGMANHRERTIEEGEPAGSYYLEMIWLHEGIQAAGELVKRWSQPRFIEIGSPKRFVRRPVEQWTADQFVQASLDAMKGTRSTIVLDLSDRGCF
ncbi:hypothetical protein KKE03_02655 [Patescibacteria group bacterium]|nr:hypothetical protein [Patescibacteria group bacterium]